MPVLTVRQEGPLILFDKAECIARGAALAGAYAAADPFPHVVMEDFLDAGVLARVAQEFPAIDGMASFDRDQERLKFQFGPDVIESPLVQGLLAALNSGAFVAFLEKVTGIEGLIVDPGFSGGGLHETRRGGHLGVHADFNIHAGLKAERRLNLIVYLNEDWEEAFGGHLELWDKQMSACRLRVTPAIGRAVLFNTSLDSYHGHPEPLACPPERARRSVATYYYTTFDKAAVDVPVRTTNFRQRPGSNDRPDRAIQLRHLINDWVPFKLQKTAFAILRRLKIGQ